MGVRTWSFRALAGLGLAAAVGCGGGEPAGPLIQAQLTFATPSGDRQAGLAELTLPEPLRARLLINGHPESGRTIIWTVTSGGGSLAPTTSLTDVDGVAATSWTLGSTEGAQTVRAALQEDPNVSLTFTATALVPTLSATVSVRNNLFVPATTVLQAGGVVSFVWATESVNHNVAPVDPNSIPQSPNAPQTFNAPFTFDQVFPTPGIFDYYCTVHGTPGAGMAGTIIVQ